MSLASFLLHCYSSDRGKKKRASFFCIFCLFTDILIQINIKLLLKYIKNNLRKAYIYNIYILLKEM